MSSSVVISVENLSKYYKLGVIGGGTLREDANRWWAKLRGRPDPTMPVGTNEYPTRKQGELWALRNVDLDVKEGEILGIIGRNGAGKSTLLKILSRITAPTSGRAVIRGRVGSLLEVGTGFHPELTGRENIYLNGAILGMTKTEVTYKLEEIVEFAEMGKFIDTPAKRYSSGMTVRLAFAVAAHLEPEILIVDEVLAVGDSAFRKKSLGKMKDISATGRTVLFVSHNLGAVSKLCSSGVVLRNGKIVFSGSSQEAIQKYYLDTTTNDDLDANDLFGNEGLPVQFRELRVNEKGRVGGNVIAPGDSIRITAVGNAMEKIEEYRTTISIRKDGQLIVSLHDARRPTLLPQGGFISEVTIPPFFLSPGEYSIEIGGYSTRNGSWVWAINQGVFAVADDWREEYDTLSNMGLVNLPSTGTRATI